MVDVPEYHLISAYFDRYLRDTMGMYSQVYAMM